MQELIGNTPLVRLTQLGLPADARLYAKLETYNPAGSVKDRVGKYMIDAAERDGLLRPGGTIIEATAGNTGLGIAFAALGRGYRVIFVVPTKFSQEKQTLIKAIQDGRYPCPPARQLYVVSKGKPQNAIVKAFLRFILEEGQQYNVPAGFIPVNEKNKAKH